CGDTGCGDTVRGFAGKGALMVTLEELRAALRGLGLLAGDGWLARALSRVAAEPGALGSLFPAVGRRCGREPLAGVSGWTVDEAARVLLLAALPAEHAVPGA